MSIGIRTPLPQDIPALLALVSQPGVQHGTGRMPYPSEAWVRARVEGQHENTYSIVGTVENTPVAWANLVRKTERRAHCGVIDISVRDDHHGQGIGRAMLGELIRIADEALGLRRLELDVLTANTAAIALYESLGFQKEGRLRGALLTQGVLQDLWIMARLQDAPKLEGAV